VRETNVDFNVKVRDYVARRDALLHAITCLLEADNRVRAAWLSGSFGRQEADEWSDLDLHVAVADESFPAFLDERLEFYGRAGVPLLIQSDMESDSQQGARFQLVMYSGPIEVDWNIGPVSQAIRPLGFTMLVERAELPILQDRQLSPDTRRDHAQYWLTFFWAMAPIGIKVCGRGDTRRAVNQYDLQVGAYVRLWRLIWAPESALIPNSGNRVLEPELRSTIPLLGGTITPEGVLAALQSLAVTVEGLHPALQELGVEPPDALIGHINQLRDLARDALAAGPVHSPGYR
jgi:predicted nucleotidyltransferase